MALMTHFGRMLRGATNSERQQRSETCCIGTESTNDLLRRFWEIEDPTLQQPVLSAEEKMVVWHFKESHERDHTGRFIVPLPMKENADLPGETRSPAVRRFRSLERLLFSNGKHDETWPNHVTKCTTSL